MSKLQDTVMTRTLPRKRNKIAQKILYNTGIWLLILPALAVMYFFTVRPLITGIWYSFNDLQGYKIVKFCGLENYRNIITDTRFWVTR